MSPASPHMQAQLLRGKSRISHFMPALESLDFLCSRLSSCGLRLDLQTGFSSGRGFCCIYWISSALSSPAQRSVHLSVWLTACGDRAGKLFTARLFALARRYAEIWRLWGKVNAELHGPLSITNSCGKGTIIGACRLLTGAVLAVSAYCLQHLTLEREAERSCSPALRSMMLSSMWRKTTPSTRMLLNIIATTV